jgi:hypothetical protein
MERGGTAEGDAEDINRDVDAVAAPSMVPG